MSRAAVRCYSQALRSTEQHAVEVDAAELAQFRAQLQALQSRLEDAGQAGQLESVQATFDTELREYQDKSRKQIERLRKDIREATAAVEEFASSVTANGRELEKGLNHELQQLNQAATSDNLNEVRGAIRNATAKISASVEQMRTANQAVIAQLKDEIRLLHEEIRSTLRRAPSEQSAANESRHKLDNQIDALIQRGSQFSVLLVVVTNLEGMRNCHSQPLIETGLRSFESRFADVVPGAALTGRWAIDQFAAVLSTEPANAIALSNDVVKKLSAPFLEQEDGMSRNLSFGVKAGVVEFRSGADPAKFQAKLKQLAGALAA